MPASSKHRGSSPSRVGTNNGRRRAWCRRPKVFRRFRNKVLILESPHLKGASAGLRRPDGRGAGRATGESSQRSGDHVPPGSATSRSAAPDPGLDGHGVAKESVDPMRVNGDSSHGPRAHHVGVHRDDQGGLTRAENILCPAVSPAGVTPALKGSRSIQVGRRGVLHPGVRDDPAVRGRPPDRTRSNRSSTRLVDHRPSVPITKDARNSRRHALQTTVSSSGWSRSTRTGGRSGGCTLARTPRRGRCTPPGSTTTCASGSDRRRRG